MTKEPQNGNDDFFGNDNEVKANWVKFGKVGDRITGTLTSVREMKSQMPGKEGQMVKIYEILAAAGEFHNILEDKSVEKEATVITSGETWLVGGGPGLDNGMRNVKVGQIVGIKFTEEKPPKQKGFNPLKVKKVFTEGKMNEEWLAEKNSPGASADGTQY